jgi:LuxR family transcriptional regulator, maltose regulon positive regulatory protein
MVRYHWTGRRTTARAWLRRFDDDALRQRPWLAILAAWEEISAGEMVAGEHLVDIAEHGSFAGRPPGGTASLESGRAMLRSATVRGGADNALANAALAADLEVAGSRWRDFALWLLAVARRTNGDREGAISAADEAVDNARSTGNAGLLVCVLGYRALLAFEAGDWVSAGGFSDEAEALAGSTNVEGYMSSAPTRAVHARIAVQRGDLALARRDLAKAIVLRPVLTAAIPGLAVQSLVAFANAHLAVGDPKGARTLLTQASQVVRQRPDLGVLPGEIAAARAMVGSLPLGLAGASSLTAAEIRVLGLLPYYLSFKEIAQRLGVKATTVKTHALAIYGKLGASTRSEAVEIAVEAGLLERFPTWTPPSAIWEDAAVPES